MTGSAGAVPELDTERLRLRGWRDSDVDAYAQTIAGDPEVMRFIHPPEPEDPAATIARLRAHWQRHGFGHWAVEERDSGELVGRIGLLRHPDWDLDRLNVEIGWILARAAWGRGIATEGAQAALRFAFETVQSPRVISIAHPDNRASRRVMEKLGLSPQGTGQWRADDVVWYALERAQWRG